MPVGGWGGEDNEKEGGWGLWQHCTWTGTCNLRKSAWGTRKQSDCCVQVWQCVCGQWRGGRRRGGRAGISCA